MKHLTYCSFATVRSSLGVVILEGAWDPVEAAQKIAQLKISPGGQLLAMPCCETDGDIPPNIFAAMAANTNRLIPTEEARALFEAKSIAERKVEVGL